MGVGGGASKMSKVVTLNIGPNQQVQAVEEEFSTVREDWNEYETASGVKIRVKPLVAKIFRIVDSSGRPAFAPDGDPQVLVRQSVQIVASGGPSQHAEPDVRH